MAFKIASVILKLKTERWYIDFSFFPLSFSFFFFSPRSFSSARASANVSKTLSTYRGNCIRSNILDRYFTLVRRERERERERERGEEWSRPWERNIGRGNIWLQCPDALLGITWCGTARRNSFAKELKRNLLEFIFILTEIPSCPIRNVHYRNSYDPSMNCWALSHFSTDLSRQTRPVWLNDTRAVNWLPNYYNIYTYIYCIFIYTLYISAGQQVVRFNDD